MPVVQYVDPIKNERITRGMGAPKKVTNIDAWLKEARKSIREIPRSTECIIEQTSASPWGIVFNLVRPNGTRVYVAIDRTKDGMVIR